MFSRIRHIIKGITRVALFRKGVPGYANRSIQDLPASSCVSLRSAENTVFSNRLPAIGEAALYEWIYHVGSYQYRLGTIFRSRLRDH
jgi:aminoglycoside N3'-acetyltransferase